MPTRFIIVFRNAYIYYNIPQGRVYEKTGGMHVTDSLNWSKFENKPYLFHVRHVNMGNHFRKVNTV